MIIIKAQAAGSAIDPADVEARARELMSNEHFLENPPPGVNPYNEETVKDFIRSEMLKGINPQNIGTVAPVAPAQPEITPQPQPQASQPEPEPLEPLSFETPEDLHAAYQRAKQEGGPHAQERMREIIDAVLGLESGVRGHYGTMREWMENRLNIAERRYGGDLSNIPGIPHSPEEWAMRALDAVDVDDLMKKMRGIKLMPSGGRTATTFNDYFDGGEVNPEMMPDHLGDDEEANEQMYNLMLSRIAPLLGDYDRKSKFGTSIIDAKGLPKATNLAGKFPTYEALQRGIEEGDPDALYLDKRMTDIRVSEADKYKLWEEPYDDNGISPGYPGSRTFEAIRNLNEVYKHLLEAKRAGIIEDLPEEITYAGKVLPIEIQPRFVANPYEEGGINYAEEQEAIPMYSTGRKQDEKRLNQMLSYVRKYADDPEVKQYLQQTHGVNLDPNDYESGGYLCPESRMIGSSKSERGPNYVARVRKGEFRPKQMQDVSYRGEDGGTIEVSTEEVVAPQTQKMKTPEFRQLVHNPKEILVTPSNEAYLDTAFENEMVAGYPLKGIARGYFDQVSSSYQDMMSSHRDMVPGYGAGNTLLYPGKLVMDKITDTASEYGMEEPQDYDAAIEFVRSMLPSDFGDLPIAYAVGWQRDNRGNPYFYVMPVVSTEADNPEEKARYLKNLAQSMIGVPENASLDPSSLKRGTRLRIINSMNEQYMRNLLQIRGEKPSVKNIEKSWREYYRNIAQENARQQVSSTLEQFGLDKEQLEGVWNKISQFGPEGLEESDALKQMSQATSAKDLINKALEQIYGEHKTPAEEMGTILAQWDEALDKQSMLEQYMAYAISQLYDELHRRTYRNFPSNEEFTGIVDEAMRHPQISSYLRGKKDKAQKALLDAWAKLMGAVRRQELSREQQETVRAMVHQFRIIKIAWSAAFLKVA